MGILEELPQTAPKVLFYDIETSMNIGGYFGPDYETRITHRYLDWRVLCFGYKWGHEDRKARMVGQPQFDSYGKDPDWPFWHLDDSDVVAECWALLNEADIVVGHNSDRFDNPKMNARFIEQGLGPPAPYRTVDTLKIARQSFKFPSNKLDHVAAALGVGGRSAAPSPS